MSKLSDFTIENGLCRGADAPADGPGTPCVILRAYHGPGGDVVVPDGVTGIFERAFAHNETIRTVHLPESVKTIGSKAFTGCRALSSINFPSQLEEIGNDAFSDCTALQEIILPWRMKEIGHCAFLRCTRVKRLQTPGYLERVGYDAFAVMSRPQELIIPCDPTDSQQIKFLCVHLVDIDALLDYTLSGCIKTCTPMEKALFRRLNTKTNRRRFFQLFCRRQDAETAGRFLAIIPRMSPEELDEYIQAAEQNPAIRTLLIDYKDRLYSAADLAQRAKVQAEKELGLRPRTLADWKKIYKINKKGQITGYKDTSPVVEVPAKVKNTALEVGANAFKQCALLEAAFLADGITLIGRSAFQGCEMLREITIPATLSKIGAGAFKFCTSLSDVYFPGGITYIGSKAFDGCAKLVIHAPAGSKIIRYAEKNAIPYVAE